MIGSPSSNGKPKAKTRGYGLGVSKGALPWPRKTIHRGLFKLTDVDEMMLDPQNVFCDAILRAPVHIAKIKVECDDEEVKGWVERQFEKIWDTELDKALMMIAYGSSGGEAVWIKNEDDGHPDLECLRDIHLRDRRPVEEAGRIIGINVYNVTGADGTVELREPGEWWWITNRMKFNDPYGRPNSAGAFYPWCEKTGYKGGLDIRRKYYHKHAYTGNVFRHPAGSIEGEDGRVRDNKDVAMEILSKAETGGDVTLPSNRYEDSKEFKWLIEWAKVGGSLDDVREYIKDMDREILVGWIIPDEVVKAGETGSGYAGRAVPALLFWTGEDQFVKTVYRTLDEQLIRVKARQTFGKRAKYRVTAESLVPKTPEQLQAEQQQAQMQMQGQGQQPGEQQQGQQDMGAGGDEAKQTGYGSRGGHYYLDSSGNKRYFKNTSGYKGHGYQAATGDKRFYSSGSDWVGLSMEEGGSDVCDVVLGRRMPATDELCDLPDLLESLDDEAMLSLLREANKTPCPSIVLDLLALAARTLNGDDAVSMSAEPIARVQATPPAPQPTINVNYPQMTPPPTNDGKVDRLLSLLDETLAHVGGQDRPADINVPMHVTVPAYPQWSFERDPETGWVTRAVPNVEQQPVSMSQEPDAMTQLAERLTQLQERVDESRVVVPVTLQIAPQTFQVPHDDVEFDA